MIASGLSIPTGPGAVALYQDSVEFFPRGTVATEHYLIDVVVYGDPQDRADGLIDKLVPGHIQAYENSDLVAGEDVSLSRCISQSTLNIAAFVSSIKTPGMYVGIVTSVTLYMLVRYHQLRTHHVRQISCVQSFTPG